jgi:hypothetical protein
MWWTSATVRRYVKHAKKMRPHTDHLIVSETHKDGLIVLAHDLTVLVQPGGQRSALGALGDLLNPAEQCDGDAVDIAPPVTHRGHALVVVPQRV